MKKLLARRIDLALRDLAIERGIAPAVLATLPPAILSRPKNPDHGDLATNVALSASKHLGDKPVQIANALKDRLVIDPRFVRVEVAGPGFLNLKLQTAVFHASLADVLEQGASYGRLPAATGERINLEFVSANPTGPLHMAHGRGAVAGDVIGRLLEATGHRVVREYYVNDAGNQVKLLVESVRARAQNLPTPEGGYGGAYVTELADWALANVPALITSDSGGTALAKQLVSIMLAGYVTQTAQAVGIQGTLRALDIHFDVWASEATLHDDGRVARSLESLKQGGWLKEEDGAVFFETSRVEKGEKTADAKDRVLKKSDGGHTYFASDIAYHKDKVDRGFERLIDIWGADHHGYIPRVRAGLLALGLPAANFEVLLVQMVSIVKDGQPYKMGKRIGNFITIDEVLAEIDNAVSRVGAGKDALRYFFTSKRLDAQIELDVEIAKKQSLENPVYYLQYGHARLSSILRKAEDDLGLSAALFPTEAADLGPITHPDELALILRMAEWPETLADAAKQREPHKIVHYLTELTQDFQSYYTRLKKEGDTVLPRLSERDGDAWRTREGGAALRKTLARLSWVRAIRDVYRAGLGLLGITALDRMDRPELAVSTDAEAGDLAG